MSYGNPLHGLDADGNPARSVPEGRIAPRSIQGKGGNYLVFEHTDPGDDTVLLSVYSDGDGPSVALSIDQLAAVVTEVAQRMAILKPPQKPVTWTSRAFAEERTE